MLFHFHFISFKEGFPINRLLAAIKVGASLSSKQFSISYHISYERQLSESSSRANRFSVVVTSVPILSQIYKTTISGMARGNSLGGVID